MKTQHVQAFSIVAIIALLILALVIPSKSVGLLVTLIAAGFAFTRPKVGLFILFCYFPFRPFLQEINPTLKLTGDIVLLAVVAKVIWAGRRDVKSLFKFSVFEYAFFLFLLLGALSAHFVTHIGFGPIVFQIRAFLITYLAYYAARRLQFTRQDVIQFLWITLSIGIILAVQAIVEKLSLRTMWMPTPWVERQLSANNQLRVYGLINNPNMLALYLSFACMTSVYLIKRLSNRLLKWLIVIAIVPMMGVWILTLSRGSWITFFIGILIYVIFTRRWKTVVASLAVIAVSYFLVALPVTNAVTHKKEQLLAAPKPIATHTAKVTPTPAKVTPTPAKVTPTPAKVTPTPAKVTPTPVKVTPTPVKVTPKPSAITKVTGVRRVKETFEVSTFQKSMESGRLYVLKKGYIIFKQYPIFGIGFGTFGDSATKVYPSPVYAKYDIADRTYTDNQYIQVLVQTGVVGGILFGIFLLGMVVIVWRNRKTPLLGLPMVIILIGMLWCSMLYNIWEDKTFTMIYFTLLGVLTSIKQSALIEE